VRPFAFTQIVSLALLAIMSQAAPASAQGFFDWFRGGQDDRYPRQNPWSGGQRQYVPPQANAYADPYGQQAPEQSSPAPSGGTGRYVAYCVRLCDGRYFPMQRHGNATSIQLCNAFCPAAKTQVFNGSAIDHAVANNGARYANLDNAFVYREKIVSGCTCNGKDAFGLAKIDVANDPTLRQGDIVASGDNQKAALAAAANKQARSTITEKAALRSSPARAKAETGPASDADERPED
jgi:hypothetical protein